MSQTQVLQVITDDDRRGAQVFALDLEAALTRLGRSVRTVALAPGRSGGLSVPTLGRRALAPATLRALRRAVRGAGVVVGHGSTTLFACAAASWGTGTPFVYRQISDSRFWANTRLRRLRVRRALARTDRVVALWAGSAATLHEDFGVPLARITVIPNGVPPDRYPPAGISERLGARHGLGLDPERPTVVYAGALVPEKGVDVAIDAVAGLPGVQLLVAGAGPERASLEARARRAAPGRVVFCGSLASARDAYATADVVVLTSRGGDSMPAALIEAGLMRLPVVATPVEGIPDIVANGDTGLLVPVGDVEATRTALSRLLDDEVFASRPR